MPEERYSGDLTPVAWDPVRFASHHPYRAMREACAIPRTQDELIAFLQEIPLPEPNRAEGATPC